MTMAACSVLVFGIYLVCMGLMLLVMPNALLEWLGMPPTQEGWIRVVGMLALFVSYYYIRAAKAELTPFFVWSIHIRLVEIAFFVAFAVLHLLPSVLMYFGLVDLAGSLWTFLALRAESRRA
jgi:hypothetical protein